MAKDEPKGDGNTNDELDDLGLDNNEAKTPAPVVKPAAKKAANKKSAPKKGAPKVAPKKAEDKKPTPTPKPKPKSEPVNILKMVAGIKSLKELKLPHKVRLKDRYEVLAFAMGVHMLLRVGLTMSGKKEHVGVLPTVDELTDLFIEIGKDIRSETLGPVVRELMADIVDNNGARYATKIQPKAPTKVPA